MQAVALEAAWYVPAEQLVQEDDAVVEYVPAPQIEQLIEPVFP